MRIIKFRAWDGKQMIYRGLHDRNWYSEDLGGGLVKGTHPDDKRLLSTMQFIGLKDKNGKEIYEGDIVRRIANLRNYSEADGSTEYDYEVTYSGIEILPFSETGIFIEEYEIIGNRFSNPDLLS